MSDVANEPVKIPIDPEQVIAPTIQSRSFASNFISLCILPIVWPFLSDKIRSSEFTPAFIGAVYLISNAIWRELSRTKAKSFVRRLADDFDLPVQNPTATPDDLKRL